MKTEHESQYYIVEAAGSSILPIPRFVERVLFGVPARPHRCGKPAAYRTFIYFDRGCASKMEQFRHSLMFSWNHGKPQAYRKGAAEPYLKDFCAKPRFRNGIKRR
jgi:hypothetical protein